MKTGSVVFSTGLAMFSMFFGSGNLVFPIIVGQLSNGHFGLATLGILLTGVLVPFLGIFAMFLFRGDSTAFFTRFGKAATFWFPLIALSLMGPFGVLARCITVAHGAFCLIAPNTPLWLFSLTTCSLLLALTIKKNRIVSMLGSILTPFLLISLMTIVVFAIQGNTSLEVTSSWIHAWNSFKTGIYQGYQTMDLLAAFFFSAFIIQHLNSQKIFEDNEGQSLPVFLKASCIGAGLLSLVYFGLVTIGAIYSETLKGVPPQEMLGFIANLTLGPFGAPILCVAVILACLTTAIILTSLFADFLRKEATKEQISPFFAIFTTLLIAFCTSVLGFSKIAEIIGPILEVTYPALIVLTLLSIFQKLWGWRMVKIPTAIALILKLFTFAI